MDFGWLALPSGALSIISWCLSWHERVFTSWTAWCHRWPCWSCPRHRASSPAGHSQRCCCTVLEWDSQGLAVPRACGISKAESGVRWWVAADGVQVVTDDEDIGHWLLTDVSLPGLFKFQTLWVQFGEDNCAFGLLRAVDFSLPCGRFLEFSWVNSPLIFCPSLMSFSLQHLSQV